MLLEVGGSHKYLNISNHSRILLLLFRRGLLILISDRKMNILVIDDDPSILRTMAHVLKKAGYDVDTAQTGKEATEKFTAEKFDAALIDIRLGEMEGTDLLPNMRKVAPKMLKILFTGTPMPEEMLATAKKGADVFLLKPVKPETLLRILEEKLEDRK